MIAGDGAFEWGALVAREVHPLKVAIVEFLVRTGEPASAIRLREAFEENSSMQSINHHLGRLERMGIVEKVAQIPGRRAMQETLYFIHPEARAGCVGLSLSAEERDAVYEHLLNHLSGIEAVWGAVKKNDFATAERLGQEYSDELRLVLSDLGWGAHADSPAVLASPPDVLYRVFKRMSTSVAEIAHEHARERAEAWENERETRLLSEACRRVLQLLDGADR